MMIQKCFGVGHWSYSDGIMNIDARRESSRMKMMEQKAGVMSYSNFVYSS